MTTAVAASLPTADPVDALMKSIRIPPRPSLLADVQRELAMDEPDPQKIAEIIINDPGMSGALLKLANSSFYAVKRKAKSVDQAITILGLTQCAALLTGLLARRAITSNGIPLLRFWDVSTRRAQALVFLNRKLRICPPDVAHTFGLFCDIGVPLLMNRFPDYMDTFNAASADASTKFTDIEDARHMTNHAVIGCLLARNWGLSEGVSAAILLHHDYQVMDDNVTEQSVRSLIALSLLAERAIQKYHGNSQCIEWEKGGRIACAHLGLPPGEIDDMLAELHDLYVNGK